MSSNRSPATVMVRPNNVVACHKLVKARTERLKNQIMICFTRTAGKRKSTGVEEHACYVVNTQKCNRCSVDGESVGLG